MLYTAVPLALLSTEPLLVQELHGTLLTTAGVLCVLQALHAVISHGSDAYSAFLMAILSLLLSPAVSIILVLFGAPVLIDQLETALCGLVLSVLLIQPLLTLYGLNLETWRQIVSLQLPLNNAYVPSCCGVVGAWLGVIPIALDWDRPWQQYPITIVLGAYLGVFIGSVIGLALPAARVREPTKRVRRVSKPLKDVKPVGARNVVSRSRATTPQKQ